MAAFRGETCNQSHATSHNDGCRDQGAVRVPTRRAGGAIYMVHRYRCTCPCTRTLETRRVVDSAKPHETIFHNINYRTAACPPETRHIIRYMNCRTLTMAKTLGILTAGLREFWPHMVRPWLAVPVPVGRGSRVAARGRGRAARRVPVCGVGRGRVAVLVVVLDLVAPRRDSGSCLRVRHSDCIVPSNHDRYR
jgi:hypothetical protein